MTGAALLFAAQAILGTHYAIEMAGAPTRVPGEIFRQYVRVENMTDAALYIAVDCFALVDGAPVGNGHGNGEVAAGKDTFFSILVPGPADAEIRCEPSLAIPVR